MKGDGDLDAIDDPIDPGPVVLRALRNAGVITYYLGQDLTVRWAQNVPAAWSGGSIVGRSDVDFLSASVRERIREMKLQVLSGGKPIHHTFRDAVAAGGQWYDMWIDADLDDAGAVRGILVTAVDVSEQKQREQTLRTLLREVSHRSKNLLAIILSIATQTGRYATDIDTFLERFRGRIQSLASSQDLVTSSDWRGAMLSELVEGQVARYREEVADAVSLTGTDIYLNPNAALHIGLALHELVVNSMTHGALSQQEGTVTLVSELVGDGAGRLLRLTWRERTLFDREAAPHRFGSVALERVVPASLEGRAEFVTSEDTLEYRLEVPESNFVLA